MATKNLSHYDEQISVGSDGVTGSSRRAGDASQEVKNSVILKIIQYAQQYGLSSHDTANLIAIAKVESGFNPDAAASGSQTSASGVFQVTDSTAKDAFTRLNGSSRINGVELTSYDRFDADSNIKYGIAVYLDKKASANSSDVYDIYVKWNTNPNEYEKYKDQLKNDASKIEDQINSDKPINISLLPDIGTLPTFGPGTGPFVVSCGKQQFHLASAGANGWAGRCLSLDMRK